MRTLLAILCMGASAHAYVRFVNSVTGKPVIRNDNAGIQYLVNDKVAPGILNRAGKPMISADSSPVTALQQAMAAWTASGANVKFLPLKTTSAGQDPFDNQNVIVFADTDALRAAVNGANAITALFVDPDDNLLDCDILFNPDALFSTSGVVDSTDLQSVAAHELGHALGSSHTNLLGATMYQAGVPVKSGSPTGYYRRVLSSEDLAFVNAVYPSSSSSIGTISGTVTLAGAPAKSALLSFIDVNSGVTLGGITGVDGKYSLAVPTGSYLVYAEPFNKIVAPGNLYLSSSNVDTAFKATFSGGNASPATITVAKGATATADIQVTAGASAINVAVLMFAGAGKTGDLTQVDSYSNALTVSGAQSLDLVLSSGDKADAILAGSGTDVRVLGKGVTVRPGSVRVDDTYRSQGFPLLRATLDVADVTAPSVATVFLVRSNDAVALSGVLVIIPKKPVFSTASVTNSASFAVTGVSPGEIISIFGTNLGPVTGWNSADFGFDSSTGALPTTLGGVKVTFDGLQAPVFYSSAGLVNVQVPFEVVGRASTKVVVSYNGSDSDPVSLPVATATPGIFTYNGSGKGLGIVVNQDYTLNTAANPAAKGSVVTVYLTGRGAVNYGIKTGQPAPLPPVLDAGGFTCTIGGSNAAVLYGAWTSTAVGLAQANITVPASTVSGELSLVLNVGGVPSQSGVTLFVK